MGIHRILHEMFEAPYANYIHAAAQTITCAQWGEVFEVTTNGTADTLTLARPTKPGMLCAVVLNADGGDLTLTVTGGYNADADTSLTFGTAGDVVWFFSIQVGAVYYWRVLSQEGTSLIIGEDLMTPSTVIDATVEQYVSNVRRVGDLIKTEILIDLTGATSGDADKDVIGAAGACHFGQVTTAINGTIIAGSMACLEVPATGADDIDLYMSSAATGAYDADGSALANAASLITKAGAWTLQAPGLGTLMTAKVTANYYLYLLNGEAVAGTYTAGKFLIELWGIPS